MMSFLFAFFLFTCGHVRTGVPVLDIISNLIKHVLVAFNKRPRIPTLTVYFNIKRNCRLLAAKTSTGYAIFLSKVIHLIFLFDIVNYCSGQLNQLAMM